MWCPIHLSILVLQNRWRILESHLNKDRRQQELYDSLKDDLKSIETTIIQFRSKLSSNAIKNTLRFLKVKWNSLNIKFNVKFLKECKIKIVRMKPKLFEMNLSVHKLLSDVSQEGSEVGLYIFGVAHLYKFSFSPSVETSWSWKTQRRPYIVVSRMG